MVEYAFFKGFFVISLIEISIRHKTEINNAISSPRKGWLYEVKLPEWASQVKFDLTCSPYSLIPECAMVSITFDCEMIKTANGGIIKTTDTA